MNSLKAAQNKHNCSSNKKDWFLSVNDIMANNETASHEEKKKRIKVFKCPVCHDAIQFIISEPPDIESYPFLVDYPHNDHVLHIYFDKNLMIREIKTDA